MKKIVEGWLKTSHISQRGYGVFILRDIENTTGQSPDQPVLEDPVWAVRMDLLIFRGSFKPQQVSQSQFSDIYPE